MRSKHPLLLYLIQETLLYFYGIIINTLKSFTKRWRIYNQLVVTHHGNHCTGGIPTQYLSTASASVELSSSYVSSHSTWARYLRDLLSFWCWRQACRKQMMADTPVWMFLVQKNRIVKTQVLTIRPPRLVVISWCWALFSVMCLYVLKSIVHATKSLSWFYHVYYPHNMANSHSDFSLPTWYVTVYYPRKLTTLSTDCNMRNFIYFRSRIMSAVYFPSIPYLSLVKRISR